MKVLVSAYACEPHCGSEPAIGWNVIRGLASRHDLTVITRTNNREAVLGCGEDWVESVDWFFFDPPRWMTFWKRGRSGVRLFYLIWQVGAFFKARDFVKRGGPDLVHHLTFASIYPASPLAFLGKPFVAGPLGGAMEAPPSLVASLPWRGRLAVLRQRWGRHLVRNFSLAGAAYRRSTFCLGATREAVKGLEDLGAQRGELEVQSGLASQVLADLSARGQVARSKEGPLRVLVASRMVFWKGVDLAIEAVARSRDRGVDLRLEISETGPEKPRLQDMVTELKLDKIVTFLGRLPGHEDFLGKLVASDVVMHPAFSESFGQVCLESLACGVPVICLKWGGPGVIVNEETGYLVEPGSREEIIEGLAEALVRCSENRVKDWPEKSVLHQRASQFTWQRLVESVDRAYHSAAGTRPPR